MENQANSPILKSDSLNSKPVDSICTSGMIQDYYFSHFLIIDQLPFDFEYEHTELFGFID
jgi:hypothetical protein